MAPDATFDELLEAAEHLAPEEQADLIAVLQRRLAELGRHRVVQEIRQGRDEFQTGRTKPASIADVLREIQS